MRAPPHRGILDRMHKHYSRCREHQAAQRRDGDRLVAITKKRELHMSVMTSTAPIAHPPLRATTQPTSGTFQPDPSPASRPPTWREVIERFAPLVLAPAYYGPPAVFLIGPWLLLVLLLIPPAALMITFGLVLVVAAVALGALAAVLASPYLLVRHLRTHHPSWRPRFSFRRRWSPAPVVSGSSPRVSLPQR